MKRTQKLSALLLAVMCLAACLSSCASKEVIKKGTKADVSENVIGNITDTMRTYWFDYTIESFVIQDSLEDMLPSEGCEFVILSVKLTNRLDTSLTMSSREFICYYSTDENAYTSSISSSLSSGLMPLDFTLEPNEENTLYNLIYEVPKSTERIEIGFVENFADGSFGDKFYVDIDLKEKK